MPVYEEEIEILVALLGLGMQVIGYGRVQSLALRDDNMIELSFDTGRTFTKSPAEKVTVG